MPTSSGILRQWWRLPILRKRALLLLGCDPKPPVMERCPILSTYVLVTLLALTGSTPAAPSFEHPNIIMHPRLDAMLRAILHGAFKGEL